MEGCWRWCLVKRWARSCKLISAMVGSQKGHKGERMSDFHTGKKIIRSCIGRDAFRNAGMCRAQTAELALCAFGLQTAATSISCTSTMSRCINQSISIKLMCVCVCKHLSRICKKRLECKPAMSVDMSTAFDHIPAGQKCGLLPPLSRTASGSNSTWCSLTASSSGVARQPPPSRCLIPPFPAAAIASNSHPSLMAAPTTSGDRCLWQCARSSKAGRGGG